MPEDIRERLGLAFKRRKGMPEPVEQKAEGYLQEAVLTFGPKVMSVMTTRENRTVSMFELVDELGESVTTLWTVVEHLQKQGFIDLVKEDRKGDHQLRLTDRGHRVVS